MEATVEETEIRPVKISEFALCSGKALKNVEVVYETHGTLNKAKDNVVLVFHALSGSAHIAGLNKSFAKKCRFWTEENHVGWWNDFVGKGKIIDTEKNFVICQNILGGCYGTTGPSSTNPETGKPYGSSFPDIEIEDIVRLQKLVLEKLGIKKLKCIIGSSLGGFIALEYAVLFGKDIEKAAFIASATQTSAINQLEGLEQIFAIENDPHFSGGDYYGSLFPLHGLMLARMIAAKRYVNMDTIAQRAKNEIMLPSDYFYNYRLRHHTESYMFHQGQKFVKRFDANTYLLILKAIQNFNVANKYGAGSLESIFSQENASHPFYLVGSITSDVCCYPSEQKLLVNALRKANVNYMYEFIYSGKGHDSFLLEPDRYDFLGDFLER